jgi:probable HAF family extracellular repeat protein
MRRLWWACAALALLAVPFPAAASYLVTDLGSFRPVGINNAGQVVGSTLGGYGLFSAVLPSDGFLKDLGGLTNPYALNDLGQVAGAFNSRPAVYSNGAVTDLGAPGGSWGAATALNGAGQVAGYFEQNLVYGAFPHAFLVGGGVFKDLGVLGPGKNGGPWSFASGINASGQVVGQSSTANSNSHAFLYSGGKMQDLGTLGGPTSAALAINASGQVVGQADATAGRAHAFLYGGDKMTDLGTVGGDLYSSAAGINASGQVVGVSSPNSWFQALQSPKDHAFLYSGGKMINLNSVLPAGSGFSLLAAVGINDKGQIAAQGSDGRAYLLTPDGVAAAPEPSALVLLALGGAGLLGSRWR